MKENDALCLFRGFSQNQIAKSLEAAAAQLTAANYTDTEIFSRTITDDLLDVQVGEHIEALFSSDPHKTLRLDKKIPVTVSHPVAY